MVSASSHTYTTCLGSNSTGMPQVKLVRDTHKSCRPGSRKLFIISFFRATGWMNSGCSLIYSISRGAYLLILKK